MNPIATKKRSKRHFSIPAPTKGFYLPVLRQNASALQEELSKKGLTHTQLVPEEEHGIDPNSALLRHAVYSSGSGVENPDCTPAEFLFPSSKMEQIANDNQIGTLAALGKFPRCWRLTESGWIAIYRPHNAPEWWIHESALRESLKSSNLPTSGNTGFMPAAVVRKLSASDLPLASICAIAILSLEPDAESFCPEETSKKFVAAKDLDPHTLAAALHTRGMHLAPSANCVLLRRHGIPLLSVCAANADGSPAEIELLSTYRRPLIAVGVNHGSEKCASFWMAASIALRDAPDDPPPTERLDQLLRSLQRRGKEDAIPRHVLIGRPFVALTVTQSLELDACEGLETSLARAVVAYFEDQVLRTTIQASELGLLHGQESAESLCLIYLGEPPDAAGTVQQIANR